MDLEKF